MHYNAYFRENPRFHEIKYISPDGKPARPEFLCGRGEALVDGQHAIFLPAMVKLRSIKKLHRSQQRVALPASVGSPPRVCGGEGTGVGGAFRKY
jgi:hypothetical protein